MVNETTHCTRSAVACPFTVDDVLANGSLAHALVDLVFVHPIVEELRERAETAAKRSGEQCYEHAGLIVPVFGRSDLMLPVKHCRDLEELSLPKNFLDGPIGMLMERRLPPPEVQQYYDELRLRVATLFKLLRTRMLVAFGHLQDGRLGEIAHSIWTHQLFYILPWTGDVYEAGPGTMRKRWTAVIFRDGRDAASFHVEPTEVVGVRSSTTGHLHNTAKTRGRIETSGMARKACLEWLSDEMRESPNRRPQSKGAFRAQALGRWAGKISARAFDQVWDEAIRITGAGNWRAAGRPGNPRRPNHRND